MLCIVSLIIALIFFWWFTHRPYTKENFATPMPYIVMVGLTSDGKVYYADMDVPIQPKWIETTLTGINDIAGSYGKLFTVKTGASVPKYGPYDSSTQTSMTGSNILTQITVDDINAVAGVNGTSLMYASSFTSNLSNPSSSTARLVSMSAGIGYSVGSDGKLYYSASPATGLWKLIDAANNWKQVCIDGGVVCAIKNDGTLWYMDKNIGFLTTGETITTGGNSIISAANITQSALPSGVTFTYISLKAGRLVGLGNNGNVYYSDTYSNPTWKPVSTQPYNSTTGVASGSAVSFSKVILMHPRMDARRKRFLGSAKSCNSNEQQIGNFCYQPCPSGRDAIGASCPYLAKYVKGIESCPTGTQNINGGCFQACPDGYTADGDLCKGTTTPKTTSAFSTTAVRASYNCPSDGSVRGRYVRVRPTTLVNNNKLCITSLIVKDSNGTILSTRSTTSGTKGVTKATDGTCIDAPVGGSTCPTVGGVPPAYLSGNTYNSDKDSGNISRSSNLYWEVDLGSIQNIKTIQFTGCTYQKDSTSSATTIVTGKTNVIQDQIKGIRIEVLHSENSVNTPPIASRTLGSSSTQTITFDYSRFDPITGDRCNDACPAINGVDSMDQGDNSCLVATGGITNRAISVPLTVSDAICTPPVNSDGTFYKPPVINQDGTPGTPLPYIVDPTDATKILSCDHFPGSKLKNLSYRFSGRSLQETNATVPYSVFISVFDRYTGGQCGGGNLLTMLGIVKTTRGAGCNIIDTSWMVGTTAYTNSETPFVCVKDDQVTCDTNFNYRSELNVCEQDSKQMINRSFDNRVMLGALCLGNCNQVGTWSIPVYSDNIMRDNTNAKAGTSTHLNYRNPKVVEGVSIKKPQRIDANCRCLNPDGSVNTKATLYNKKCIQCSSPKDTFYPRGIVNSIAWTDSQAGTITVSSTNSLGEISRVEDRQFETLEDAKNSCELYLECKGITKYISSDGYAYYKMGTSTPQNSGDLRNNTCWQKIVGSATKVRHGDHTGSVFSSLPIPRAFADDYKLSTPNKDRPTNVASSSDIQYLYSATSQKKALTSTGDTTTTQASAGTPLSLIDYLPNAIGQANAGLAYKMSIERPDTYYNIRGLERIIKADISSTTDNFGICVGPCDPEHPLSDPIQMLKDSNLSPPLYVLYGTMCYDSSQMVIDKPSIPATITPSSGNICPNGFADTGTTCLQQCNYNSKDNGDSCTTNSKPRAVVSPSYSCPDPKMPLVGSVCLLPCEGTDLLVGEYCEPSANTLTLGSNSDSNAINCTRTTYSYSSKYKSSQSNIGKWLCDSDDDLNSLLAGYLPDSGATYYVNENDIVCVADDPTTGMYYCQSVKEAVNQTQDTTRDDNNTVCNKLVSAYQDLSNNIDIISSAKTNAQNANLQVVNIQITLQGVYNSICPAANSGTPMCTTLQSQLTDLGQNINAGSGANSNILNPIQVAMSSRDNLVAQMTKFQCEY